MCRERMASTYDVGRLLSVVEGLHVDSRLAQEADL